MLYFWTVPIAVYNWRVVEENIVSKLKGWNCNACVKGMVMWQYSGNIDCSLWTDNSRQIEKCLQYNRDTNGMQTFNWYVKTKSDKM